MPDQFAADAGQHIDPQGHVTYDFDGHVHADGIDLDAAASGTPANDRRIRWLRADGGVAAEVLGYETTPAGSDHLALEAGPDINGYTAQLSLDTFTGSSFVTARAFPGPAITIIDHLARSNFLKLKTAQDLQADIGAVTFLNVPAGNSSLTASVPWSNNHTGAAILSVVPSAAYGMSILPRVNAINQILFAVTANPVLQNITVNWLTFGN